MKKIIIISLSSIAIISSILKLYTVDFSIPAHFDDLRFILDSIQYGDGDFFLSQKKHPGWPLFLTPFVSLIESNNFLDFSNIIRSVSLSISTISIIPMYLLSKKFFNEKFSLAATSLFAFEPHLNYNSGQGLSEPLLILVFIITFLFILNNRSKFHYLAFIFAGFCWWIRIEVIAPIFAVIIISFFIHRKTPNFSKNLLICFILLIIVIAPLFVQRQLQFDDPFYVWYSQTIFSDSYAELLTNPDDSGFENFISNYGAVGLIDRLANGFINLFVQLYTISFPYLIILLPFGILFSLRPIDHEPQNIKANWIILLTFIAVLIIPFAIINERRFLFPLYPFLIILSTIPIYRVTNFGLNTFGFKEKQKSQFLIIVICIVLILSIIFTSGILGVGYGSPNYILEQEKIKFTQHLIDNYSGRMLKDVETTDYLTVLLLTSDTENHFKNFKSPRGTDPYPERYNPGDVVELSVHGKNIEELITNGKAKNLKFIGITEYGSYYFPYLDELYKNDKKYNFLTKIMDSKQMGYQKLKMKIFEIDYTKFKSILD